MRAGNPFSLDQKVGEGTHGVVYRSLHHDHPDCQTQVAVKRMRPSRGSDGVSITAYREMILLRSLRHENVVRMTDALVTYDADEEDGGKSAEPRPVLNLVFENCPGGDLGQHLRAMRRAGKAFSPAEVATLTHQLLSGLAYLHSQDVMHRDIKPANLLVDGPPTWRLRIGDFGLARRFVPPPLTSHVEHVVVTLWYRAPELLLGARTYAASVDLWAAGCILAELLTCTPLLPGKELGNGEPIQKEQLLLIFKLLGTPTTAVWPTLEEAKHWKHVKRWPEWPELSADAIGRDADTARDHAARAIEERVARERLPGAPPPSAAWHAKCLALLTSLLSYRPDQRPTAAEAVLSVADCDTVTE